MSPFSLTRVSPVHFRGSRPLETVRRGDWEIVLAYEGEGEGPWLVDLSHRAKWDIQGGGLNGMRLFETSIPRAPGECAFADGWLINRMNRTQAALWDLAAKDEDGPSPVPFGRHATETSDSLCLLAVVGGDCLALMERLTPLDIAAPGRTAPYLVQGPVLHVPAQIVILHQAPPAMILLAFSRGYGQAMAEAILDAGKDLGLAPGGEKRLVSPTGPWVGPLNR